MDPTDPPVDPTDPPVEPTLYCGTATNAEHQAKGRAYSYGINPYNPYYATGTANYLGQGDSTQTTLKETATGKFSLVASCS